MHIFWTIMKLRKCAITTRNSYIKTNEIIETYNTGWGRIHCIHSEHSNSKNVHGLLTRPVPVNMVQKQWDMWEFSITEEKIKEIMQSCLPASIEGHSKAFSVKMQIFLHTSSVYGHYIRWLLKLPCVRAWSEANISNKVISLI